jgi:hypothetical protein
MWVNKFIAVKKKDIPTSPRYTDAAQVEFQVFDESY